MAAQAPDQLLGGGGADGGAGRARAATTCFRRRRGRRRLPVFFFFRRRCSTATAVAARSTAGRSSAGAKGLRVAPRRRASAARADVSSPRGRARPGVEVEAGRVPHHASRNAGPDTRDGRHRRHHAPGGRGREPASGCSTAGLVLTARSRPRGGWRGRAHAAPSATARPGRSPSRARCARAWQTQTRPTTARRRRRPSRRGPHPRAPGSRSRSPTTSTPRRSSRASTTGRGDQRGPAGGRRRLARARHRRVWAALTRPSGCTQTLFPTTKVTCSLGSLAAGETVTKVLGVSWSTPAPRRSRQPSPAAPPTRSSPTTPRPRRRPSAR